MRSIKLNYTNYLIFTVCSICIIFTPIFSEFAIKYINPNNSEYINEIHVKHYVKIFFSILFFAGFINIPFLFFNKQGKIIYFIILLLTLYITSFIDFIHVLIFQSGMNSSSMYSIFATNKSETLEFIFDYSSFKLVIGIIVFIIIPIVVYYICVLLSLWKLKKILFFIYLACYVSSVLFIINRSEFSYINEISFFRFYNTYTDYKNEIKKFNLKTNKKYQLIVKKINPDEKETQIIIIGESTGKYHMQLYGYNRQTTPELKKIKNKLIILAMF